MTNTARYNRQILLPHFGMAAQEKLGAAKVLIIGAGGLGVPALQYLAGAGVGTIGILDGDVIGLSNLHRQVLYTTADIGQVKATVAAQKLRMLNPEIVVNAFPENLAPGNALQVLADYDIIVDGTDNFAARYLINDACVMLGKPFVYGAAHQYEGHVSVFNLGDGPTYRCLYPVPPSAGQIPDCNTGGVLGMVPGIIGLQQALEVIKISTGIGKSLSGSLKVYDFLEGSQYRVKLKTVPQNKRIRVLQKNYDLPACSVAVQTISVAQLRSWQASGKAFNLIDVREPDEFAAGHLSGSQNAPLSQLEKSFPEMDNAVPVVLYCQRGSRSEKAIERLLQQHPTRQLLSLAGGLDAWNAQTTTL